jgi:hypothetical protein
MRTAKLRGFNAQAFFGTICPIHSRQQVTQIIWPQFVTESPYEYLLALWLPQNVVSNND